MGYGIKISIPGPCNDVTDHLVRIDAIGTIVQVTCVALQLSL